MQEKLDIIGMEVFTKLFLEAHEGIEWIFNPEEFALYQPPEIITAFHAVYHRELRKFHLAMISECMPKFQTAGIARVFDALSERDIPKELIEKKIDEVIAGKK